MTDFQKCFLLTLVTCAVSFPYPISQPVYPSTQLSAQAVPQISYKQPAAAGYIPQTQYVRQPPAAQPVYDSMVREGLQNYATNNQNQALQQLLVPVAAERQVPKVALPSAQYYLNQIQSAQLAAQAQHAFASSQQKAPQPTLTRPIQPISVPQQVPSPQPQQYSREKTLQYVRQQLQQYAREQPAQYVREQPVQYVREQPAQYVREQPQTRYIARPVTAQYEVQQQPQEEDRKEKEDYDLLEHPQMLMLYDMLQ
nr:mediator of RNA polymerase II transcription subunit 15-like [Leptinotarsa decemlineata]